MARLPGAVGGLPLLGCGFEDELGRLVALHVGAKDLGDEHGREFLGAHVVAVQSAHLEAQGVEHLLAEQRLGDVGTAEGGLLLVVGVELAGCAAPRPRAGTAARPSWRAVSPRQAARPRRRDPGLRAWQRRRGRPASRRRWSARPSRCPRWRRSRRPGRDAWATAGWRPP